MNQPEDQSKPLNIPEVAGIVPVDNIEHFAKIVAAWHGDRVGKIRHLLTVPAGATFEIGEGTEAKEIVLTGENLDGFKFGVEMALMLIGTLPFLAEFEEDPASDSAAG